MRNYAFAGCAAMGVIRHETQLERVIARIKKSIERNICKLKEWWT